VLSESTEPDASLFVAECLSNGTPGGTGDVNGDGTVGLADIMQLVYYIIGSPFWSSTVAVDGPGTSLCKTCHDTAALTGFNRGIADGCAIDGSDPLCGNHGSLTANQCGCDYGEIFDCNLNCAPSDWLGDEYCDDEDYEHEGNMITFNCEALDFDAGACAD
jgi:hypothetical protein